MSEFKHIPILAEEITSLLIRDADGVYLDGTLGLGGHSGYFINKLSPKGFVIGLDKDEKAIEMAKNNVADQRLKTFNLSYVQAKEALSACGVEGVSGALFDLGLSSYQLDDPSRGFSFLRQGPLDMRFDSSKGICAADIVNTYAADKMAEVFKVYGEERNAEKIALAICTARRENKITTTSELAAIIEKVSPRQGKTHPATKVFQALRIAVNDELSCVENVAKILPGILLPGGRAAVLTFHSTEDRIIKYAFKELAASGDFALVNKKVIEPAWAEIKNNPRARSAKLRVIEKIK